MVTPSLEFECPEKWENMTPQENGRFCGKCERVIIDFTSITNNEILRMISESGGKKLCGHFNASQLQSSYGDYRDKVVALYRRAYNLKRRTPLRFALLSFATVLMILTGCNRYFHPFQGKLYRLLHKNNFNTTQGYLRQMPHPYIENGKKNKRMKW
jgi:hypothetical protein